MELNTEVIPRDRVIVSDQDLEKMTGTPVSTWRRWGHLGTGPKSWKLGARRVYWLEDAMAWLREQENCSARGGGKKAEGGTDDD